MTSSDRQRTRAFRGLRANRVRLEDALQGIVFAVAATSGLGGCSSSANAGADAGPYGGSTASAGTSGPLDAAPPDPCAPIPLDAAQFEAPGSTCGLFVSLPCGLPPEAGVLDSCNLDPLTCKNSCETNLLFGCGLAPVSCDDGGLAADAAVVVDCVVCSGGVGRRPRGLRPSDPAARGPALGEYFAAMARLEAASVFAFRDLCSWLDSYGAPRSLRRAAERAVGEERRHARVTARLARRFGGEPRAVRVERTPRPSMEELLIDNVVEGCIGETYGALVACWQSEHAGDREIGAAMAAIARDETGHASLAWSLLRWGARRIDAAARCSLREQVVRALALLRRATARVVDPAIIQCAGHPSPAVSAELLARFELWALTEASRALAVADGAQSGTAPGQFALQA